MRLGLALLMASVASASLLAASGRPVDVATRANGAGKVVVARVMDVQPRFDTNEHGDRIIISRAWIRVEDSLKGSNPPILPVDVEGGTVGALTLSVSDMPTLRRGDRAVFFLNAGVTSSGAYQPHRRGLGVMKLDRSNRIVGSSLTLNAVKAEVRRRRR
jgi:hypothetical protein